MSRARKALYGLLVAIVGMLCVPLTTVAAAPIPKGYERAVSMLPAHQWAWVTRVDLVDRNEYGATYHDRRIEIPRKPDDRILIHEVGHVVAIMRPDLEAEYCSRLKGTKVDCHERFAEAYRYAIEGRRMDRDEELYIRDRVLTAIELPTMSIPMSPRASNPCGSVVQGEIVPGCRGE